MSQSKEVAPPNVPNDAIILQEGGLLERPSPSPPPVSPHLASRGGRKPTWSPIVARLSQLRQQAPAQVPFTSLGAKARKQRVNMFSKSLPLFGASKPEDTAELLSEYLSSHPDVREKFYPKTDVGNVVGACADYYADMHHGTKAPFLSRFVSRGVGKRFLHENGWDVSSSQMQRASRIVTPDGNHSLSVPRGHNKPLTLKQQAHIRAWFFYCSRVSPNITNAKGVPIRFLQDTVTNIYSLYSQACLEQQVKPVGMSTFFRYKPAICKKTKKLDDRCDTCGKLAAVEKDMLLLLPSFLCCCTQHAAPPRKPPLVSEITPELEQELLKNPTLSDFIDRDLLKVHHQDPELEDFDRFITFNRTCEAVATNFEENLRKCITHHESLHIDICMQMRELLKARPSLKAHKYSSKRQQASFQRAIAALIAGQCLIVMDFKENLSLGLGPDEFSSHFRNRPQRQLLGCAVLFLDEEGFLKCRYVSFLSQILNKNPTFVYHAILRLVELPWFKFKTTSFWFDKGSTHFWNLEMCCYLLSNFGDMGYTVDINFFGAGHGKNLVDGHFSLLSRWKRQAEVRTRVLSSEQLISEWKQMLRSSNLRKIEHDLPTLDIDFVDFSLSNDQWVKVPRKIVLPHFKIWYRFERLPNQRSFRCKLFSNATLKKDFPLKFTLGSERKHNEWKMGFAAWTNLSKLDYFSKYYDNEMKKRILFQNTVVEAQSEESEESDVPVVISEDQWADLMPEVSNPEIDQDDPDAMHDYQETQSSEPIPAILELEREGGGVERVALEHHIDAPIRRIYSESALDDPSLPFEQSLRSAFDVDDAGLGSAPLPADSALPEIFGQDSPSQRALAAALGAVGEMPSFPSTSESVPSRAPQGAPSLDHTESSPAMPGSSSSSHSSSSLAPLPMSSHRFPQSGVSDFESEMKVDSQGFKVPLPRHPPATPSRSRPRSMSLVSPMHADENTPPRDAISQQSPVSTPSRRMSDSSALREITPIALNPNTAPRTPVLGASRRSRRHRLSNASTRSQTPIRQALDFDQLSEVEFSDHSDVDGFLDA